MGISFSLHRPSFVVAGFGNSIIFAVLWVLYLSINHVGRDWHGYGWESQLCETGFLAIFLAPFFDLGPFPKSPAPPRDRNSAGSAVANAGEQALKRVDFSLTPRHWDGYPPVRRDKEVGAITHKIPRDVRYAHAGEQQRPRARS